MKRRTPTNARRRRGEAMFREVYGPNAPRPAGGQAAFFDLLVLDQQFAEVWSRRALPIPSRRLLTMGVLAAIGRADILELQFRRTLETGELDPEQIREVVIHLITYVGTPSSGDLYRAGEAAIAAHAARSGNPKQRPAGRVQRGSTAGRARSESPAKPAPRRPTKRDRRRSE